MFFLETPQSAWAVVRLCAVAAICWVLLHCYSVSYTTSYLKLALHSGKKRLQVSIVIKTTRQWMVLTQQWYVVKSLSIATFLPLPFYTSSTWSSTSTVDAQWNICKILELFHFYFFNSQTRSGISSNKSNISRPSGVK